MLYFVKNDHRIVLKSRWGSRGTASFAAGPWRSLSGGLGGNVPEKVEAVYVWRVNNSLKYWKHSKLMYFECKLEANLFLYALK